MGVVATIGYDHFPRQGNHLGKKASVCFRYDLERCIDAVVVRDDMEEPFRTILALSDGRYVEASECQYTVD